MTFGADKGVLIAPTETPPLLTAYCDLCSMQPERLISDVLRDFDLHSEDPVATCRFKSLRRIANRAGGVLPSRAHAGNSMRKPKCSKGSSFIGKPPREST